MKHPIESCIVMHGGMGQHPLIKGSPITVMFYWYIVLAFCLANLLLRRKANTENTVKWITPIKGKASSE